ncbi:cold shock-like protein cspA, partial [Ehrlichia ruminantium]
KDCLMSQRLVDDSIYTGYVKWFSSEKGYGFIRKDHGDKVKNIGQDVKDIFVHITALQKSRISELKEGQKVKYQLDKNNGKFSAINLEVLEC